MDERLGTSQEKGAVEFVARAKIKNFVAMHRVDFPLWKTFAEIFIGGKGNSDLVTADARRTPHL
ncbi:MAG: hypothetical protein II857_09340 [Selenomonadaceae bacterium]|nr:hypothetical protein [Selenomonadaceae bacterium]